MIALSLRWLRTSSKLLSAGVCSRGGAMAPSFCDDGQRVVAGEVLQHERFVLAHRRYLLRDLESSRGAGETYQAPRHADQPGDGVFASSSTLREEGVESFLAAFQRGRSGRTRCHCVSSDSPAPSRTQASPPTTTPPPGGRGGAWTAPALKILSNVLPASAPFNQSAPGVRHSTKTRSW